jgi:hypothetical protein
VPAQPGGGGARAVPTHRRPQAVQQAQRKDHVALAALVSADCAGPSEHGKHVKVHKDAGHLSRETAVKSIAADYDVEEVAAESGRIEADQKKEFSMLPAAKSTVTNTV